MLSIILWDHETMGKGPRHIIPCHVLGLSHQIMESSQLHSLFPSELSLKEKSFLILFLIFNFLGKVYFQSVSNQKRVIVFLNFKKEAREINYKYSIWGNYNSTFLLGAVHKNLRR
jgi:hypothetical protein